MCLPDRLSAGADELRSPAVPFRREARFLSPPRLPQTPALPASGAAGALRRRRRAECPRYGEIATRDGRKAVPPRRGDADPSATGEVSARRDRALGASRFRIQRGRFLAGAQAADELVAAALRGAVDVLAPVAVPDSGVAGACHDEVPVAAPARGPGEQGATPASASTDCGMRCIATVSLPLADQSAAQATARRWGERNDLSVPIEAKLTSRARRWRSRRTRTRRVSDRVAARRPPRMAVCPRCAGAAGQGAPRSAPPCRL